MTADQVRAILGPPDDIRTAGDPDGPGSMVGSAGSIKEIWAYGTDGHLALPTLGQVRFTKAGQTDLCIGGHGTPPDSSLFSESELRGLLRLLHRVTGCYSGTEYNPLTTIQAVNTLIPLGKARALAAVEEYLRIGVTWDESNMFAVLHTLFDVPEPPGYFEPPAIGILVPEMLERRRRVPRLPIAIQDDIPFAVGQWAAIDGSPESPSDRLIPYLHKHGIMRSKPLVPTTRVFDAAGKLNMSVQWLYERDIVPENGRMSLMVQALRMLDTIYVPPSAKEPTNPYWIAVDENLPQTLDAVSRCEIRWDPRRMIYTFANGTTLPEQKSGK
ncbi:MAG: hypothetical protein QM765_44615 [Myxococcales bacterium]